VGLEHEKAGEAAEPVDVGEAGGLYQRHGGCGKIVAEFGICEEEGERKREKITQRGRERRASQRRTGRKRLIVDGWRLTAGGERPAGRVSSMEWGLERENDLELAGRCGTMLRDLHRKSEEPIRG
jgi:hypothetical protein